MENNSEDPVKAKEALKTTLYNLSSGYEEVAYAVSNLCHATVLTNGICNHAEAKTREFREALRLFGDEMVQMFDETVVPACEGAKDEIKDHAGVVRALSEAQEAIRTALMVRLHLDDLGVSQRWVNKFANAGIEMVGDLLGHTEKDLADIGGIGDAAINELKRGLAERNLSHVIKDDSADDDGTEPLLDWIFGKSDSFPSYFHCYRIAANGDGEVINYLDEFEHALQEWWHEWRMSDPADQPTEDSSYETQIEKLQELVDRHEAKEKEPTPPTSISVQPRDRKLEKQIEESDALLNDLLSKNKRNIRKCPSCKTYIDTGGWKDGLEWTANFCAMCGAPLTARGADIVREREAEEEKKREWEELKSLADGVDGAGRISIEDLALSARSYNCLKRSGIHYASQLIEFTENDLLNIRNFGVKSVEEVRLRLADHGLRLRA